MIRTFPNCDVAIDFSCPEAAADLIGWSLRAGVPTLSGTTGWLSDWDHIMALRADVNGTFFYASNFSLGVNLLFAVNQYLAKLMDPFANYDVSMTEIHHTHKKDAPSGTAITLAEDIISELDRKCGWASAREGERDKISIHSKRQGDVPGTHEIVYESPIDKIMLRHEAKNRKGFALGATLAAEWLPGKVGLFGMKDLLNL